MNKGLQSEPSPLHRPADLLALLAGESHRDRDHARLELVAVQDGVCLPMLLKVLKNLGGDLVGLNLPAAMNQLCRSQCTFHGANEIVTKSIGEFLHVTTSLKADDH